MNTQHINTFNNHLDVVLPRIPDQPEPAAAGQGKAAGFPIEGGGDRRGQSTMEVIPPLVRSS